MILLTNRLLPRPDPLQGLPFYLSYTQLVQGYGPWKVPHFSRMFVHSWSLAIEEQFYLLWPLLVYRAGWKRLAVLIPPLLVVPIVLRARGFDDHLLLARCDGLGMGALMAGLLNDRARWSAIARPSARGS